MCMQVASFSRSGDMRGSQNLKAGPLSPLYGGSGPRPTSNTMFHGPPGVLIPNSILVSSAISVQWSQDEPRDSMCLWLWTTLIQNTVLIISYHISFHTDNHMTKRHQNRTKAELIVMREFQFQVADATCYTCSTKLITGSLQQNTLHWVNARRRMSEDLTNLQSLSNYLHHIFRHESFLNDIIEGKIMGKPTRQMKQKSYCTI